MPEPDQNADRSTADSHSVPQSPAGLYMMQAFQNWQQFVNQYTQDLLSNSRALDTSGKALESLMQLKRQADQAMELAISSMQMPTKSDVELILQKLSTLEGLVRDLTDKVDDILDREHQL